MTELQPIEQYWDEAEYQQQMHNKLYCLHSQNQILKASLQKADTQIRTYLQKITELHDIEVQISSKNSKLTESNRQLQKKYQQVESVLKKRNEEYAALYNYLFVEPKRSFRELVMKQVDLNNNLNQIQHESDSQIISQLRSHLKQRHQQIITLSEQINKLNDTLLDSTHQYQEIICRLKEEKIRLEYQVREYQDKSQSKRIGLQCDGNRDIYELIRHKSYEQELKICEQQIESLRIELIEAKQKINQIQLQKRREDTLHKIEKKQPENLIFGHIQTIIRENNSIKEQLHKLHQKYQILTEQIPDFQRICEELDQYLQIKIHNKQLSVQIEELRKQNKLKQSALRNLQVQIKRIENREVESESKQHSFKTATAKTFDKLKKIISVYVPCFSLYGFCSLGLDDDQTQIVEDKSLGLQYELNRLSKQLSQKIIDLGATNSKIRQLQSHLQQQGQQIKYLVDDNKHLKENIEKLTLCLNMVANKRQRALKQQLKPIDIQQDDSEVQMFDLGADEDSPQINFSESRINILQRAVRQLQVDRCQLLSILREKDQIISEIQAKLIKSQSKVNVYNLVQAPNITLSRIEITAPSLLNQQQGHSDKLKQLRSEIDSLGQHYEIQTDLALKEQTIRYANLQIKYKNMLQYSGSLQQSIAKLKKQLAQKNSEILQEKRQQVVQMVEQVDNLQNVPNQQQDDDQNALSQFTIQTISDLLKKYEKEFNKFAVLYQQQITKSAIGKPSVEQSPQDLTNKSLFNLKKQVSHLQDLLAHNVDIISILQKEINAKEESHRLKVSNLQQTIIKNLQTITQLQERLDQYKKAVNELENHQIESMVCKEKVQATEHPLKAAFMIIDSKNREMVNLAKQNSSLSKLLVELSQQINSLKQKDSSLESPLAQKEIQELKGIIEQYNLPLILQQFLLHLQHGSSLIAKQ